MPKYWKKISIYSRSDTNSGAAIKMYQSHSYDSAFLMFGKSSAPTAASPYISCPKI